MNRLYVIGGKQRVARTLRDGNDDWNGYEKGIILAVNTQTGASERCLEYVSPPEVCAPEEPAITFQASTILGDRLYTCTQTEAIVYSLPDFSLHSYLSLPIFNDLHHIRPGPGGTIFLANAGLEQVLQLTLDGQLVQAWHVLGEPVWDGVQSEIDYRLISTKPHRSHPNYLSDVDGEIWVTRFHQGDTVSLTQPERRINLSEKRVHDGVFHQGRLYFTTVDGQVIIARPDTLRVEEVIDLNEMHPAGTLLGWCRSLLPDGDRIWVGFSRIRPTRLRENVAWVARGFKSVKPTHIAYYDLARRECLLEIDLEPAGLNAVYSIFPALETGAAGSEKTRPRRQPEKLQQFMQPGGSETKKDYA